MWEPITVGVKPCPDCGAPTKRAWLTKATTVIGDEIDHVQVNGCKTPIRFRSRAERKRYLKEHGWREQDYFAPMPGSDKSKHGDVRWDTYDAYTANNVRILIERAFKAPSVAEPDVPPVNIRWFDEQDPTKYADGSPVRTA